MQNFLFLILQLFLTNLRRQSRFIIRETVPIHFKQPLILNRTKIFAKINQTKIETIQNSVITSDKIQKIHNFPPRLFINLQLLVIILQSVQKYRIMFVKEFGNFNVLITEQLVFL